MAQTEPDVAIAAGVPTPNAFAMVYVPTVAERFWRNMGYRRYPSELPEDARAMPGWAMTNIHLSVSFADRVRLLLSGKIRIDCEHAMSESVDTVITASSVTIMRPGEKF